ncbi:tyrosine-type recombinase/integrase [Thermoleptolyngbya sichuanensis XZ-Cy5]|uniref:tyrosine-type recombinase/integrase n=1 Tax=Thermoleptolyngbya sichuanensis TaxID=2885951 RepID=UPI00240E0E05|nr:tyrosine-type recombinase/integrase [Thermoleptolyngbya sichuanensis XZ-Cy5]
MKINRYGQAEALSKAEFQRVLTAVANPTHRLIFALCWYTCERPITILRLKVEQVYQDAGARSPFSTLVLPSSSRKDGVTRECPVSPALRQELRAYTPPLTGWLFPGAGTDGHLSFSAYYKALARVFAKLGLRGYSTYSTRRGSITELARAGLNTRVIQQVSGHRSLQNLQRYVEIDKQTTARAIALL